VWPWGHLAVGYLAYAGLTDRRFRRAPDGLAVVVCAFGTQFPDLVDKPLAWSLGVIPNGRSLAHSALVATVVIVLVGWYLRSRDRGTLAVAFGLGYYSHLVADAFAPFLAGRWDELAFLGWPLLPPVQYAGPKSFYGHFAELARELAAGHVSAYFAFQLVLVVLALGLWVRHGYPGLGVFRSRPTGQPGE